MRLETWVSSRVRFLDETGGSVCDLRRLGGFWRCDSLRKLSRLRILLSVVFFQPPSSPSTRSASARMGSKYSGRAQRSYSACAADMVVVWIDARLSSSCRCASLSGCPSLAFAASIIHCSRSCGLR